MIKLEEHIHVCVESYTIYEIIFSMFLYSSLILYTIQYPAPPSFVLSNGMINS